MIFTSQLKVTVINTLNADSAVLSVQAAKSG